MELVGELGPRPSGIETDPVRGARAETPSAERQGRPCAPIGCLSLDHPASLSELPPSEWYAGTPIVVLANKLDTSGFISR
jgi:hypothetical protein